MKKSDFDKIEKYMLAYCGESVHDQQHIYRVLFHALEINRQEGGDRDVVIAACLLHDIARTLEYKGLLGQPIYTVQDGKVADGTGGAASFFTEYRYKLQKVYDKMLTDTGRAIAVRYRAEAEDFYGRLLGDLRTLYADGERRLNDSLTE